MAELKKPITLTKLYPGLNKGGPRLPISQLSQMGLNMTQINTLQLSNGTRPPWGKWRTISYRGQGIQESHSTALLGCTHGRGGGHRGRAHPHPFSHILTHPHSFSCILIHPHPPSSILTYPHPSSPSSSILTPPHVLGLLFWQGTGGSLRVLNFCCPKADGGLRARGCCRGSGCHCCPS